MNLKEKIGAVVKIATDPRHRRFRLQRRVTDVAARERAADRDASRVRSTRRQLFGPIDAAMASGLDDKGFAFVPGLIDPGTAASMRLHLGAYEASDPYRKHLPAFKDPADAPEGTHVAFYRTEDVVRVPGALAIANDARVLAVVAETLGAVPTISAFSCWWSLPTAEGTAQHAENFHRDVDDTRFVKLFCYLTDVDLESGPHVFVEGTHRENRLTDIRRYTDEEVASAFGRERFFTFTGPAGTSFLENTYGFHRGYPPKSRRRLNFQVLYTLNESIYGPKVPVLDPHWLPEGADPYINRVYIRSR